VPIHQKVNQYGNLPQFATRNKRSGKYFVGTVHFESGVVRGFWQRRAYLKSKYKPGRPKLGSKRKPRGKQRPPKLLIRFQDAHAVKQRLGYRKLAKKTLNQFFQADLRAAIKAAMATAKP
jgi:hypothetical protein